MVRQAERCSGSAGNAASLGRFQGYVLGGVVLALWAVGCSERPSEPPPLGRYAYSSALSPGPCPLGERRGPGGVSENEQTKHGIKYMVRTPANYNPGTLHPLLMVYAPAGSSRFRSERLTDLTFEATAAGFIVAYADSRRLSLAVIPEVRSRGLLPKNGALMSSGFI